MKKILALLLAALAALSLAACGGKENTEAEESASEDWRTWGIISGYGTLISGEKEISVCLIADEDCIAVMKDRDMMEQIAEAEFPGPVPIDNLKELTCSDTDGDGTTDLYAVIGMSTGGEYRFLWHYSDDEGFVFDAKESTIIYPDSEDEEAEDTETTAE